MGRDWESKCGHCGEIAELCSVECVFASINLEHQNQELRKAFSEAYELLPESRKAFIFKKHSKLIKESEK